jgi:hypothetical protein
MIEESNADAEDATPDNDDIQPMSFNIFVLSLNASALIQLGEASDASGESMASLPLARQTIDILAMLEQKTRGNLSGEEERLLHQILFDLRMRYSRRAGT